MSTPVVVARSEDLTRLRTVGGTAAAGGALACLAGAFVDAPQLLRSWLLAFGFWVALPLGAIGVLLIHVLTGGRWGAIARAPLVATARTLPLMIVAFVPIALWLHVLYPWARPEQVAASAHLRHLTPYLNAPLFVLRAALALGLWTALAFALGRARGRTATWIGAAGLIAHVVLVTVTAVDWTMSLDPEFVSLAFGVEQLAGDLIAGLSAAVLALGWLARRPAAGEWITSAHYHDLGNLLLAFVMLWSYVAFSEWMIVWSGNLPSEAEWYVARSGPGWRFVGLGLIALHFFVPFALLLTRRVKRSRRAIACIAAWLLAMRLVDHVWVVVPTLAESGSPHWLDLAAPVALGGLWLSAMTWLLGRRPLLVVGTAGEAA